MPLAKTRRSVVVFQPLYALFRPTALGDILTIVFTSSVFYKKASVCPVSNHVTQTYLLAGAKPLFLAFAYVDEEHARIVLDCV